MSRHIRILTPEGVALEYRVAGVGSRFLALLLDTVIQALGVALLGLVVFLGMAAVAPLSGSPWWVYAAFVLGAFLVLDWYFVLFEAFWNGQTPGKRLAGLRVIRDGGFPLDFRASVVRNLLRLVDFLPGLYLVGVACVMFHPQARRVGDMAAGTLVVRESAEELRAGRDSYTWRAAAPVPELTIAADALDPEQYELVETFLRRRAAMAPDLRCQMAEQIGGELRRRLPLDGAAAALPAEQLMEEVVRARARRAGL